MRVLIFFIIFCKIVFAQYDSTMFDLIKTTYERSFDKHIVYKYLHSNSENKTNSAILTIAQSEDTLFVPELLKLNLIKYGSEICFALAQIGNCEQSINFLWKCLNSSPRQNQLPKIFFAIGKIGNEDDLKRLVEFYNSFDGPIFPFEGISEAILQFQIRGIKSDDAKAILETEITHQLSNKVRIEQALFALARYGNNDLSSDQLIKLFESGYAENDEAFKQFLLMNVNKNITLNLLELEKIISAKSALTKIQLVKVLHFFEINSTTSKKKIIDYYSKLLNDDNKNVAIQTAISIKSIKDYLNDFEKVEIKNIIDSLLFVKTKSPEFRGELFLSRFELFGDYSEHQSILNKINIPTTNQFQFYVKNPDLEKAVVQLFEVYGNLSPLKDKIDVLQAILQINKNISDKSVLAQLYLGALSSNIPPLISIVADGIDSSFILENLNKLKEITNDQLKVIKDNPDFLEATISLINLAKKFDIDFYKAVIENVKSSKLYSIRKFLSSITGSKQIGVKELDEFYVIWNYAFKFKQVNIKTTKGDITIKLNSELAPISVANFCMLAAKNFYNDIVFHRVVPGFVIQVGDPTATGWGGPGYDIISEFSDSDFGIGYVGMASAGKDTEGSQFFIMQGSHPHLDSRYTLFAKVLCGMDVVYNITEEDKIISTEIN